MNKWRKGGDRVKASELINFLDELAIQRGQFKTCYLYSLAFERHYMKVRELTESDTRKIGIPVLFLDIKGRGKTQSLNGIYETTADIDKVTKKFVYAYVHNVGENGEGRVLHIRKNSPILNVITK